MSAPGQRETPDGTGSTAGSGLERLNAMTADELDAALRACNSSRSWVAAVAARRPYPDRSALLAASDDACRGLDPEDVAEALSGHPRIGERAAGDGRAARLSRREQAAVGGAEEDVRAALADGNRAYEQRFGQVFLVRAADRDPEEILGELRRRLGNDAETEQREVLEQLCQITRLRLQGLLG